MHLGHIQSAPWHFTISDQTGQVQAGNELIRRLAFNLCMSSPVLYVNQMPQFTPVPCWKWSERLPLWLSCKCDLVFHSDMTPNWHINTVNASILMSDQFMKLFSFSHLAQGKKKRWTQKEWYMGQLSPLVCFKCFQINDVILCLQCALWGHLLRLQIKRSCIFHENIQQHHADFQQIGACYTVGDRVIIQVQFNTNNHDNFLKKMFSLSTLGSCRIMVVQNDRLCGRGLTSTCSVACSNDSTLFDV